MEYEKELKDILDCIAKFDDSESFDTKGRYFDIIQNDVRNLMSFNSGLDETQAVRHNEQTKEECKHPYKKIVVDIDQGKVICYKCNKLIDAF